MGGVLLIWVCALLWKLHVVGGEYLISYQLSILVGTAVIVTLLNRLSLP